MSNEKINLDVSIPGRDWTSLRSKKLFWVPDIIAAHGAISGAISQAELARQSPEAGKDKYSIAVVRDVCTGVPVQADRAFAIARGFNRIDGRKTDTVVGALFLLKDYLRLFSEQALARHGISVTAAHLGLRDATLANLLDGGRITAHVARVFLEGVQRAYDAVFDAEAEDTPPEIAAFLACDDLRAYVTTDRDAGHREVRQDASGDYLCAPEDLLPAPEGWTDWT